MLMFILFKRVRSDSVKAVAYFNLLAILLEI